MKRYGEAPGVFGVGREAEEGGRGEKPDWPALPAGAGAAGLLGQSMGDGQSAAVLARG